MKLFVVFALVMIAQTASAKTAYHFSSTCQDIVVPVSSPAVDVFALREYSTQGLPRILTKPNDIKQLIQSYSVNVASYEIYEGNSDLYLDVQNAAILEVHRLRQDFDSSGNPKPGNGLYKMRLRLNDQAKREVWSVCHIEQTAYDPSKF